MKKYLLLILLFIGLIPEVFAQPQYSYTNTSAIGNTIPFSSGTTSNLRQYIYYPTDFTGAPATGTITDIYFKASAAVTPNFTNLTIKMGTTSLTAFTTTTYLTGLTTVYNGSYNMTSVSGNWVKVTLQNQYSYSNASNLVVEVSQTGYSPGFSVIQTNTSPTNRSVFGSATATSGSMQVRLAHLGFDMLSGPFCPPPTNVVTSNINLTGATFNWTAPTGATGYQYAITTTATPPATGTGIATNSHIATGLNNGTNYWFHVRTTCSASSSVWVTVPFTTTLCAPVPLANITVSNITTVSANINWTAVTGSSGYEYSFGTNAAPPATGTPQPTTSYNATLLNPGTTYYFHVRNKCASPSNSAWTTKSFVTLPCPSAGTPVITNNVPGSVTFTWPGNTSAGVSGYQWAVTGSAGIPSSWNNTNNLTATVNNLISGSTYYIHVRTDCNSSKASYTPLMFVNPFPPCASPGALTISEVNMHGANIKWTSSANVANGYQYALTTSATPPTTGLTLTSDTAITVVNLVGGQKYYFYVRTHCGANTANPPVLNLSGWKIDSFTTPLTCLSTIATTINNVTSNSADIEWTNFPGIYGYEYVISTIATAPPASFSGAAITFHTLAAASLLSGTNYYFHIRVRCDTFNFSPWATTPFNTQSICNSAPSSPTLTSITPTTANFSWAGVPGAQQYQYSVTTSNTPNPNSNTYTSQTSAKVLSLMPNAPYWFHVRAYCSPDDLSGWESVPFSTVSVSVNSIGNSKDYTVVAYPNPVKDLLHIEVTGTVSGKGKAALYDLSGKMLKVIELNENTGELNVSDLAQGIYLLHYKDEKSTATLRVQKL